MHFADALTQRTKDASPMCIGLDPVLESLPEGIGKDIAGVEVFCRGIIDAVKGTASCIKPQLACFELLGWKGMKVFWEVCSYAKGEGLLVIADGKRGDIGRTCAAYADAYLFDGSPVDALTVNPYLGSDGITPFIERCAKNDKGIFILVKTSNPSSGELQDLPTGDETVHEHLAQLVESWGMHHLGKETKFSCVGAVVGATYPEELKYLRTLMPHCPFLIPGYGAQGGTAADVKHGFLPDPLVRTDKGGSQPSRAGGTGAIVAASRSVIYASSDRDWQEAAKKAAEEMGREIAKVLSK